LFTYIVYTVVGSTIRILTTFIGSKYTIAVFADLAVGIAGGIADRWLYADKGLSYIALGLTICVILAIIVRGTLLASALE